MKETKKIDYIIIIAILVLTILRFIFISTTSIIDDEAYYHFFSKHLSGGYIDHGPGIALFIKISTILFGVSKFGVRIFGVILFSSLGIILYVFGKRYFNHYTGLTLSALLLINMFFHASGIIMTPDTPLLIFGLLTIIFYYKSYFTNANNFFFAGIVLGLALLSKISIIFPAFGIFIFPFLSVEKRYLLKDWRYYFSFVVAFFIFLPFIIWNYNNDWEFIRYQGGYILKGGRSINDFLDLWGALFLLLGPILFYFTIILPFKMVYTKWRNSGSVNDSMLYFSIITLTPLIYFIAHSAYSKFEVNWPAPVFFGSIFCFAISIGKNWLAQRKLLLYQLGYSFILILVVTIHTYFPFLPLSNRSDPTTRYYEYECFETNMKNFLTSDSLISYRIISNNYQIPSMINYLVNPKIEAICLSIGYHKTYYSYLYPDEILVGKDYIYIAKGRKFPSRLTEYFTEISFLKYFESLRNNHKIKGYSLWLVKNYKGKPTNN
jgi:4-amino-4-deoxy-L-arabinose transferase-like glycosyltransferase